MYWSRNASLTVDERLTREPVDRLHRCIAEQSAKLNGVAYVLANHWDYTHSRSLLVHHTDGGLISNYTTDS